jgi:hypothetical protein
MLFNHIMDKEMEQRLQQMTELLLGKIADINAQAAGRQKEMEARAEAHLQRMLAFLRGLSTSEERTPTCQVLSEVCPENLKACPEEMEADMVTFEGSLDRKEATHMEATPGEKEAAVVRQELFKEETNVDNVRSLEDRYADRRLVVRHCRGAQKRIQDSIGSRQKLSSSEK